MKRAEEKPEPAGWRMYALQRRIVRRLKKKRGGSEADQVRAAIEHEGIREGVYAPKV